MKRLSTIIMALALVLGMSQCKKQEIPTNGNGGEKVYVTLNVNNGESIAVNVDNGGRHAVAPNLGVIQFRNGDVLYVGNNGKYIGQLTYNNGAFGGPLNPPTGNDFLHFYFLGGKAPATAPTAGTTTDFTISIADQHDNLPVLCYGHSTQKYTANGSNYSAVLEYKCALVRFKLNKATDYKCTLLNMPTEATIDFANNAITPTATTDTIDLYREEGNTGVRWAILLPGTKLSADGHVTGTGVNANSENVTVNTALKANDFIKSGFTLKNPVFAAPGADYAVKTSGGVLTQFSVSSTQKVYFSRANLKYNATTHVWSFHTNQIDECPGSGTGTGTVYLDGGAEMDRFCWGYSGNTSVSATDDWVDGSRNLNWTDGTDWGCALEGTAYGDHWRTLTAAEWEYLLKSRQGKRFLRVAWKQMGFPHFGNGTNLAGVTGIIIAPDGYTGGSSYSEWNQVAKIHTFGTNVASVNALLNDGCVFLPALGYRDNDQYKEYYYHYTGANGTWMEGNYWTATGVEHQHNSTVTPEATAFHFEKTTIDYSDSPTRNLGMCVRLVWDAN